MSAADESRPAPLRQRGPGRARAQTRAIVASNGGGGSGGGGGGDDGDDGAVDAGEGASVAPAVAARQRQRRRGVLTQGGGFVAQQSGLRLDSVSVMVEEGEEEEAPPSTAMAARMQALETQVHAMDAKLDQLLAASAAV
eukprot:COSAG01_NODE_23040_length_830_cov_4.586867_1_plen_139_part_00